MRTLRVPEWQWGPLINLHRPFGRSVLRLVDSGKSNSDRLDESCAQISHDLADILRLHSVLREQDDQVASLEDL